MPMPRTRPRFLLSRFRLLKPFQSEASSAFFRIAGKSPLS